MHVDARAQSWAALALAGVGPRPLVQLLRAFGDPEAVLAATPAQRRAVVTAPAAAALDAGPDPDRLAATFAWLAGDGHGFLAWDDADYPPALLEIADPPPILFCLGRRELLARPALAIVGSRNATPQGCEDAEAFALALSAAGLTIVSGLAQGIDAAAHRAASPAPPAASPSSAPARIASTRRRNRDLAHVLAKDGLILSEFPRARRRGSTTFPVATA